MISRPLLGLCLATAFAAPLTAAPLFQEPFPRAWHYHDSEAKWQRHLKLLGKPMPPLELSDWHGGRVDLAATRGKILVVDFWATWCGPCLRSVPHNNEMVKRYGDKIAFIGVCGSSKGQEKMVATAERVGIHYPIARDKEGRSAQAWNVMWWPTYGVVDGYGNLRALGLRPDRVDDVIDALIAEGPVPPGPAIPRDWLEGNPAHRAELAPLVAKPAPPLVVSNPLNGAKTDLADLRGKVVLLDFWATWCGPCLRSIPENNALLERYGKEGLVILGVCHPRGGETMAETVKKYGIRYPVVLDTAGKTGAAYKVDGYPDYYLVDREGNLSVADCKNASVEDAIGRLLQQKRPESKKEPEKKAAKPPAQKSKDKKGEGKKGDPAGDGGGDPPGK